MTLRALAVLMMLTLPVSAQQALPPKTHNALFPDILARHAQANAEKYPWAAVMKQQLVDAAAPWMAPSEDDMWDWMFGPHINRSWMVWSDGYCPSCKKDVKMYTWEMDPWTIPWKVRCPHCKELFPKNDFAAFHRSGLNEQGIFEPALADRSLLFNAEHPDPGDPLHMYGVDDGEGYVADGHRWRFIGAYLIYGQWKRLIYSGIVNLSSAYAVTGNPQYAYRAAILLDRVADVYHDFDFGKQGWVYETQKDTRGQISTWHDACSEVREMALAYDRIFEAARSQESALVAFLSRKAREKKLPNPKASWTDIQRNIETRILASTLENPDRIRSNYPTHDVAAMIIKTVLAWPDNREEVYALFDRIIDESTKVDGLSGEKGLGGYSTIAPRTMAEMLGLFSRLDPDFLRGVYERHPVLHQTYRFHIDTWCLDGTFLPMTGDSGRFAARYEPYGGATLNKSPGVGPSMFTFLWNLYELTGDPAFVQTLYKGNERTLEGLPYDLFVDDPAAFQEKVRKVIDDAGATLPRASVNKEAWCLAVLKSGEGPHERALWLDYDAHERHSHADGMNIGLFAKGLDLIPEFGYPPVGYGGWEGKATWYKDTAAHVTVVVDKKNQLRNVAGGTTTLWADGQRFRAVQASAPQLVDGQVYERTVAMIDLDEKDAFIFDCFRVVAGSDHANFFGSGFGGMSTNGLTLSPGEDYWKPDDLRHFMTDPAAKPGWTADWTIEDRYGYLEPGRQVKLRYTGLTHNAEVSTCEAWIDASLYAGAPEWVPRLMVRRRGTAPLASSFVAVIEPYERTPKLLTSRRVPLETINGYPYGDELVGVETERADGRRDLCAVAYGTEPVEMLQPGHGLHVKARMVWVLTGESGCERVALLDADWLKIGNIEVTLTPRTSFVELAFKDGEAFLVAGSPDHVASLAIAGQSVKVVTP